jgi:glycosyltransferase involved in cell wall biosynthesis
MNTVMDNAAGSEGGKDSNPLVSVILPTRDRPKALQRAIQSILKQTFQNFEIIVVDNGTASGQSALAPWKGEDRIRYFKLPPECGRSKSRNLGLTSAKGLFIAYLDDDDFYAPDHLETLISAMTSGNLNVAYTDAVRVHERWSDGEMVEIGRETPYSQDYDLRKLLVDNYIPNLCLMHRRACLTEAGLFDESLETHEDWDLWLRLAQRSSFTHIPRVTCSVSWRTDGSSTTSSQKLDFDITRMKVYRRYRSVSENLAGVVERQQMHIKTLRPRYFRMLGELLEARGMPKGPVSANLALRALAYLPGGDELSELDAEDKIITPVLVHLLRASAAAEEAAKFGIRDHGKAIWRQLKSRIKYLTQ